MKCEEEKQETEKINPAFLMAVAGKRTVYFSGISKREYFAAAALQGLCANESFATYSSATLAYEAVKHADAIIKQLKETI